MSSDARRAAWIGVLAGIFGVSTLAIAAYRATAREHRHPILRLLAASATALLLPALWGSLWMPVDEGYEATELMDRKAASPTLMYERWRLDMGGTGGEGCADYRIRTL